MNNSIIYIACLLALKISPVLGQTPQVYFSELNQNRCSIKYQKFFSIDDRHLNYLLKTAFNNNLTIKALKYDLYCKEIGDKYLKQQELRQNWINISLNIATNYENILLINEKIALFQKKIKNYELAIKELDDLETRGLKDSLETSQEILNYLKLNASLIDLKNQKQTLLLKIKEEVNTPLCTIESLTDGFFDFDKTFSLIQSTSETNDVCSRPDVLQARYAKYQDSSPITNFNYKKTYLNATHEINNYKQSLDNELDKFNYIKKAYELSLIRFNETEDLYNRGLKNLFDVINRENEVLDSQLMLSECLNSAQILYLQLSFAEGKTIDFWN
jgi:outer membrane protein TolC